MKAVCDNLVEVDISVPLKRDTNENNYGLIGIIRNMWQIYTPFLLCFLTHRNTSWDSESVLLCITSTSALVLRRGDIESVSQGELDATGIVVLHFPKHHPIAVKHDMVDAAIEEVITWEFDIQTVLEEVFADTEQEHWIGAVNIDVWTCVAVGVHVEVCLQQPVVR